MKMKWKGVCIDYIESDADGDGDSKRIDCTIFFRWTNEFMVSLWIKVSQRWINYTGKMLYMSPSPSPCAFDGIHWEFPPLFSMLHFFLYASQQPKSMLFDIYERLPAAAAKTKQQNRMVAFDFKLSAGRICHRHHDGDGQPQQWISEKKKAKFGINHTLECDTPLFAWEIMFVLLYHVMSMCTHKLNCSVHGGGDEERNVQTAAPD